MSEARDKYYEFKIADEMWKNHRPPIIHYSAVDYAHELEQENKQLKESQTQKRIIKLCERLDNAERQNKQMIEALKLIKHKLENDPAITDTIWIDDNPMRAETAVDRINHLLGIKE